ncbi:MAG: hypothetical protein WCM76_14380 [Bacteroidota bacterium]
MQKKSSLSRNKGISETINKSQNLLQIKRCVMHLAMGVVIFLSCAYRQASAADRYWVGDGGTWNQTAHWSATSGGSGGASLPTSADNVVFNENSFSGTGFTVTIPAFYSATCKDLTWINLGTDYPAIDKASLFSGDIYVSGNLSIKSSVNFASNVPIRLVGTAANTISCGGITINANIIIGDNAAGNWTLLEDFSTSGNITYTFGTLNTNGFSLSCNNFAGNNSNSRTLNLGSSIISVAANAQFGSDGLTLNAGTSTIRRTTNGGEFAKSGSSNLNFYSIENFISMSVTGGITINGSLSYDSLNISGIITLGSTAYLQQLYQDCAGSGKNKIVNGTIQKASGIVVFPKTTISNVTATGGATFKVYGGTNINSTGFTWLQYSDRIIIWRGYNSSYWSVPQNWADESGAVLNDFSCSGINVVFDANSFPVPGKSVVIDAAANVNSMDWSAAANWPTFTNSGTYTLTVNGSFTLCDNMYYNNTGPIVFAATTTGKTIKTFKKAIKGDITFSGNGGGWTLLDSLNVGSFAINHQYGTINTGGFNVKCKSLNENYTTTRSLITAGSRLTITGSGTSMNINTTGLTCTPGSSEIRFTNSGSSTLQYNGAITFNNVNWTNPSSTGTINNTHATSQGTFNNLSFACNGIINGNNTYNGSLTFASGKTYTLQTGKTQTIGASGNLIANGTCEDIISISSSTAGSTTTLISKTSGTAVTVAYANISDIKASTVPFYANNSLITGTSSGWTGSSAFYWVGNGGNWNDPLHWSMCPTSYSNPGNDYPNSSNVMDVYFTANSFNTNGQSVNVNAAAYCASMNWTGVVNTPTLTGSSSLNIKGSLTLTPSMANNYTGTMTFSAITAGNTITCGIIQIKSPIIFGTAAGGSWTLLDSLISTSDITHAYGNIILNGNKLLCTTLNENTTAARTLDIGGSILELTGSGVSTLSINSSGLTMSALGSTIKFTGSGTPYISISNALTFGNIAFSNPSSTGYIQNSHATNACTFNNITFAGNGIINGNNIINGTLFFAPGKTYTLQSLRTQTLGTSASITAPGICPNMITINASTSGTAATISKSSGTTGIQYCYLQDITATGGATFNTDNSFSLGNCSGWNWNSSDLYWISGTGNWSNAAQWSACSGGSANTKSIIPNTINNASANFDGASGNSAVVTVDATANCNNMIWTGAVTPTLTGSAALNINGSLTLISSLTNNYSGTITFSSTATGKTITTGTKALKGPVVFGTGAGGGWTLLDSLVLYNGTTWYDITHNFGSLTTNGNKIRCSHFISTAANTRSINLGNSIVEINYNGGQGFNVTTTNLSLNAGTSTISLKGSTTAGFYVSGSSQATFNNIEFPVAAAKDTLNNNSAVVQKFNNVTFSGNAFIKGSNLFTGALTVAGGKTAAFQSGKIQDFSATGTLVSTGSCGNPAAITAMTAGNAAIFNKDFAPLTVNWVSLKDNTASGATDFTANNSAIVSNVTSWVATPTSPTVTIAGPAAGSICSGTSTLFTATIVNGGTAPSYKWKKNGVIVSGANAATWVYTPPVNGEVITCVVTSNAACVTYTTATSNSYTVIVKTVAPTAASATASPLQVCAGSNLTLTGTATDATAWSWNGPGGYTATAQSPVLSGILTSGAGMYTVTAINGCGTTSAPTAPVTVWGSSPTTVIASASPTHVCAGSTLNLASTATNATSWSWSGPHSFSSTLQNPPAIVGITTADEGIYTLAAINACGSGTDTARVWVNAPIALAGPDVNYCGGSGIQIGGASSGSSFTWAPASGLSNPSVLQPFASPSATTTYTLTATTGGCTATDEVIVTLKNLKISGTINYQYMAGLSLSPYSLYSNGVENKVYLYADGETTKLDSAVLQNDGSYTLNNVLPGNYNVTVKSERIFEGVGSPDALAIQKHNIHLTDLAGIYLLAAHTQNTSTLSATDALNCRKRFVQTLSSFTMGDWLFAANEPIYDTLLNTYDVNQGIMNRNNTFKVKMTDADHTLNIGALCVGDADGSRSDIILKNYPVPTYKSEIAATAGQLIEVPLSLNIDADAGAISLIIDYPSNLQIEEVMMNGRRLSLNPDELIYNIKGGKILLSWVSTEALQIKAGEPFITVSFRVPQTFAAGDELRLINELGVFEIADAKGNLVQNPSLELPLVIYKEKEHELILGECVPNPVSNNAQITYYLPTEGHVTLAFFNMLGEQVMLLTDEDQSQGYHTLQFSRGTLASGIYNYRLCFSSEGKIERLYKKVIVNR